MQNLIPKRRSGSGGAEVLPKSMALTVGDGQTQGRALSLELHGQGPRLPSLAAQRASCLWGYLRIPSDNGLMLPSCWGRSSDLRCRIGEPVAVTATRLVGAASHSAARLVRACPLISSPNDMVPVGALHPGLICCPALSQCDREGRSVA